MIVTVDGIDFHGEHPDLLTPFRGFQIEPEKFRGWDDPENIDLPSTDLESVDGGLDGEGRLTAREIEIGGWAKALSPEELEQLGNRFRALAPRRGRVGSRLLRVEVQHMGRTLWTRARMSGGRFEVDGNTSLRARYQLKLRAADPFRYGETHTQPIGAIFHRGNAEATPVVRVTGGTGGMPLGYGLRLFQGSTDIGFLRLNALAAGARHDIDMRTVRVKLNGAITSGLVHSGQGWLVPGMTECRGVLEPISGAGTATVTITDTST